MARPRSKIDITCQNPECKYYLKDEGKDIVKRGKNRAGHHRDTISRLLDGLAKHAEQTFIKKAKES